jgi:hypothetical protein
VSGAVGRRAAAVAVCLALGLCPGGHVLGAPLAGAGPSERDRAYEEGAQAEEAGDFARAAASYERAYRMTTAAESGPRLLFLRAAVAAHLRADDVRDPRAHLCPARALLREHLAASPAATGATDPLAAERADLARVEQRLAAPGAPDCDAPAAAAPIVPEPTATPAPASTSPPPAAPVAAAPPAAAAPIPAEPAKSSTTPPGARPATPPITRALRILGGVSLGVGVASLGVMGGGIAVAERATDRGRTACWKGQVACPAGQGDIADIVADGERGDQMVRVGAILGGLGVLTGVVLLAVSKRAGRARLVGSPVLAPGTAGVALSGRF